MPDNAARIPRRYNIWGDIFHHNTAGTDRTVIANSNSGANNNTATDPNIIADINRCREFEAGQSNLRICRVKSSINLHVGTAQYIFTDVNSIAVEDRATKIRIESVTCINIAAVVTVERRLNFNCFANRTEQCGTRNSIASSL